MCDGMNKLLKLEDARVIVFLTAFDNIAVRYENCEIKEGGFLVSAFGRGKTLDQACDDYLNRISGKTLVFDSQADSRKEVRVLF